VRNATVVVAMENGGCGVNMEAGSYLAIRFLLRVGVLSLL
jgi:hypothetical protein